MITLSYFKLNPTDGFLLEFYLKWLYLIINLGISEIQYRIKCFLGLPDWNGLELLQLLEIHNH